ncbi:MAG: septum formation protein Maf [Chloroflexi bacterium]|nr:septum formation protein Maf [Chloroflexota bacterium]
MAAPSELVLASASPRRRELLHLLSLPFQVRPSAVNEGLRPGCSAEEEAVRLATAKAQQQPAGSEVIVVAADTLVALGMTALGKPADAAEARQMLRRLRSAGHRVVTGVAVARCGQCWADVCATQVWMRAYTGTELEAFVASGAALDKAGAYAIQDTVFQPVERIDGCYCNVVGLPLGLLLRLLQEAAYPVADIGRPAQCAACPDWPAAGD